MLDQYLGDALAVNEVATKGYKQDGYTSILRFDTWKTQMCTVSTKTISEIVGERKINTDASVDIDELIELFTSMKAQGCESVDIYIPYVSCEDEDDGEDRRVELTGSVEKTVDLCDADYLKLYASYVSQTNSINRATYNVEQKEYQKRQSDVARYNAAQKMIAELGPIIKSYSKV